MDEVSLDAQKLGNLGASFFYSFALMQLPVGIFLDRFGPRYVVSLLCFIGSIGSFVFASAEDYPALLMGRVLQGIGMSAGLMGSLKAFSLYFHPTKFSTLSGLLLSFGTLGNILSSSPLAYLSETLGWRMTFVLFGFVNLLISGLVFFALPKQRVQTADQTQGKRVKGTIGMILKTLSFWQIGTLAFFRYGTFVAMQGLWFGPYLIDIKGFSPILTGNLLFTLSIGIILGSAFSGYLTDRVFRSPKLVVLFGVSLYTFTILFFTGILTTESSLAYFFILFFCGFFNSFGIHLYSHAKNLFPAEIAATVMSSVNFFTMAGGAFFMHTMGSVIKAFGESGDSYPKEAYHLAFLSCFVGCSLALLFYYFSKPKENKNQT